MLHQSVRNGIRLLMQTEGTLAELPLIYSDCKFLKAKLERTTDPWVRHYFEQVVNQILDDLVRVIRPRRMSVIGKFNVRGGIASTVVARHPAATRRVPKRQGRRSRG